VKTLDLAVSTAAARCVVTLLGASSWSLDTIRYRFVFFVVLVFPCFSLFIFDLLCKRFSSPPCIGSAVGCYIIYSGVKACFEKSAQKYSMESLKQGLQLSFKVYLENMIVEAPDLNIHSLHQTD
jgi:hypothetical protein